MSVDMHDLLENTALVSTKGKINIYSLKHSLRKQSENFSVCLPDNMNEALLGEMCEYLSDFSQSQCKRFDPIGKSDDSVYEFLPYEDIADKWKHIDELIAASRLFAENNELVPSCNLSVCELEYGEKTYYLCAQQLSSERFFKKKKVIMSTNDLLQIKANKKVFLFGCNIDFIVRGATTEDRCVFVFDRKKFISLFNYYEYLQADVKKHSSEIETWGFLSSSQLIIDKIGQKNVYRSLAKVFSDKEYVAQINETKAADLKHTLLERSGGKFDETDFDGDTIKVTSKNIDKVMKMLAKGFKYNFFANRAEEQ